MPSVVVHRITVYFEGGSSQDFDPDQVVHLYVLNAMLHVVAVPTPHMRELAARAPKRVLVSKVWFSYTAADGRDYETEIEAGGPGDAEGADHIRFRVGNNNPIEMLPVPPQLIHAAEIRPKGSENATFAVLAHSARAAELHSVAAEVGWHRRDCTWYYPF